MIAKHYEFPFPFLVTPARFPYPSFQPPCDKKSPIPHLDGVECRVKVLLKPQNMSYNRVWKGILIPQYCFFFTTSFRLELRLSLSLIPFSFPIPHPVPRFWQIPLSEKAKEVKSRIPSRHFASSRIPHCRSRAAEKSATF